ncbi:MAG TPA: hypothetical protein VGI60_17750 [Chthoniobacterales bacterium]|jgi:hypothetical protein
MKTTSRWLYLRGWFLLSMAIAIGALMGASAFAGPGSYRDLPIARTQTMQQQPAQKKVAYLVHSSCSAIPVPLERVSSSIPSTATPMIIIGDVHDHTPGR